MLLLLSGGDVIFFRKNDLMIIPNREGPFPDLVAHYPFPCIPRAPEVSRSNMRYP
jgi:hypothetical protein